jgi:nucleotide-binding universal stress UspA family protein
VKVLLAIDDSVYSQSAIQAVITQFRPDGLEVRVLNVIDWPPSPPESLAFTPDATSAGPILALYDQTRRRGEVLVARAAEELRAASFAVSHEVREGDVRQSILECAAEWTPDVIVLGSHGRKSLNRLLLGSVSENVVRYAQCSVEVVRGLP